VGGIPNCSQSDTPPNPSGTGFSREGGISGDEFWGDVLASSRLKPVPHENAVSLIPVAASLLSKALVKARS
jgi:hypothetical protein